MISLIIGTYNGEQFIDRCLESVFSQTISQDKLEVIIIDDASTDNTVELLKQYKDRYGDRVRLILRERNSRETMIITRNIGVEQARGKYIMFLDQDDWYREDACEILYEKMEADDDLDYIEYSINYTDFDGNIAKVGRKDKQGFVKYEVQAEEERIEMAKKRILPGTTYAWSKIYRKTFLLDNKIYHNDREIRTGYSDNFFSGLVSCYCKKFADLYEPLYFYRRYTGSYSKSVAINDKNQFERCRVGKVFFEECARRGLLYEKKMYVEFVFLRTFLVKPFLKFLLEFDPIPYELMREVQNYIYEKCPAYMENEITKGWNSFTKPIECLKHEWTPEYLDSIKIINQPQT